MGGIKEGEDERRREREKRSGEEGGEEGGEEQPASGSNSWSTPGGRWNTARVKRKGY